MKINNMAENQFRPGQEEAMLLRRPALKRLGNSVQVHRISKTAYNELIAEYVRFLAFFIEEIIELMIF